MKEVRFIKCPICGRKFTFHVDYKGRWRDYVDALLELKEHLEREHSNDERAKYEIHLIEMEIEDMKELDLYLT